MDNYVDKVTKFVMDSIPERRISVVCNCPWFHGLGLLSIQAFVRGLPFPIQRERNRFSNKSWMATSEICHASQRVGYFLAIQEQTIAVNRRGGLPAAFVIQNNNFEKLRQVLPKFPRSRQ